MIPLHAAIKNDHVKCVGLLLQYGSDLLRLFGEFPTILAYARYHGNPEMVRLIKAFMEGSGVRNHRSAQNYNVVVMVRGWNMNDTGGRTDRQLCLNLGFL